jgi:EAL domain-containing protein (putative c-di-GMP-specific phosphodiesterase class I)/GGDEF domain-containing protein
MGWEALTRGPHDSYFHRPDNIFSFAEETGLLFDLEKACQEIALMNIGDMGPDQKIFLNVHPKTVLNRKLDSGELYDIVCRQGLKTRNVVQEITERKNIQDFKLLNEILQDFRKKGFLIAVDDVGSGFSGLQSIAEIRPDFIKIDMSLVRNIHNDPTKRALMETFVIFADKINCEIIAEGIEEENELKVLIKIGVHYGQGYLIGRPAYPKPMINEDLYIRIFRSSNSGNNHILKNTFPIGNIAEETVCVDLNTQVKNVKAIFDQDAHISGLVVMENEKPVGLVMRQHLDRHLGKKYGIALYYNRPIHVIMDRSALIVDENISIEKVSQIAMNREKLNLYDNIIVTGGQLLKGVVSVQTLLDQMTRIRVETAKGANPLTGLPGNISIEQELYRRHDENVPFSIIFVDLDFFKSFNDKYGFEEGDRIILFTANLLRSAMKKYATNGSFLGHIGGDDFILFVNHDDIDVLCRRYIRYFDHLIRKFYDPEDLKDGKLLGRDRDGNEKWIPVISVSIAVLDVTDGAGIDLKDISAKVAQLKKYAKSLPGSVYVRDRRSVDHA